MAGGGAKAIAAIDVGERVIATDPQTGESGARAVERVIRSEGRKTLVRVRVSGQVLTATDRHPFWVESQGAWRDAAELRPGDVLREPDGERAAVESVRVLEPEPERVHNLTVAGLHTYYAGKAPVLVHNAGCVPDPPAPKNGGDYRPFTAGNYRDNLIRRTGRNPGPAEQAHHVFPQRFVRQFDRAGINIHQPNLVVWWEKGAHSRASRQYNDRWEDFFDTNQNPTDGQVLDFGRRQARRYGLEQPF
jgi:NAD(P)-dependent dehydrogenase (short-subunit alcohol dehydrogenase family)